MIRLVLLFYLLCITCIAHKRHAAPHSEDYLGELERDLKNSAQLSCARFVQFTTPHPSLVYVDYPTHKHNVEDLILSNFSAIGAESRVVRTKISEEEIKVNYHIPIALTGANKGFGAGLVNGTAIANESIST